MLLDAVNAVEGVANWAGIICFLGGIAFTFKLVRDQERSILLWTLPMIFLGPVAAIAILALPPQGEVPRTQLDQVKRTAIALSALPLTFILVLALSAATSQGAFKIVKASDVSFGFTPHISEGQNYCGRTVNVEGAIVDASPVNAAQFTFALSDPTGKTAPIVANERLSPPHNGDRVRENALVTCSSLMTGTLMYTLVEHTRKQLP